MLLTQNASSQTGKFESRKLQQTAILLSKEIPYAKVLYQFTESYLNQLLALSLKERNWKMKADDVQIEEGELEGLSLVDENTNLIMGDKNNRYIVSLVNGKSTLIRFSCPMSYQLITQKKLKELESEYMKGLAAYRISDDTPIPTINKNELKKTAPGLYVQKGVPYFLEAINNDLYYVEEKGKPVLAYDPAYIAESICNMLLTEHTPCEVTLRLIVRQYGFKTDELTLPLKQWIAYCRSMGCNIYVGIEKMNTNKLKACVFAVNEHFKYNHVMNVEVPYTLLNEKKGEIEADIAIFIPTHNMLALFEELNMTNKKIK